MKKFKDFFKRGDRQETGSGHSGRKKLFIGIAAGIAVVLILAIIAPFVIDLNKYKGTILSRIRPAVNRNVDFESINLTVLTGIGAEIKGLKVPENPAFASGNFVTLDSVKVRLRLLPLLKGEVRIAKLVFNSPSISIIKNAQGVFNFSDMAGPKEEKKKESNVPAILASFGIHELAVNDGTLVYEDRKAPDPGKGGAASGKKITVSMLDVDIEDISLTDSIKIAAEGSLLGQEKQNFKISGNAGPIGLDLKAEKMPLDITLSVDSIPLKNLTEALGLSLKAASGNISGDVTAKGELKQQITIDPKITVRELVMQRKPGAPAAKSVAAIAADLSGKIVYDALPQDVALDPVNLAINGNRFIVTGKARHVTSGPAWNFTMRSVTLTPSTMLGAASAFGINLPAALKLNGPAKLQASTAGTAQDMAVEGGVEMSSTEITYGKAFHKPEGLTCTFGSTAGIKGGVLDIKTLNLVLYNLALTGAGTVNMKDPAGGMNVRFDTKPVTLQGWDALIPFMRSYKLGGAVAMKGGVTGTKKSPSVSFQASSQQVGFTVPANTAKDPAAKSKAVQLKGLNLDFQGKSENKAFAGQGTFGIQSGNFADIALGRVKTDFRYAGKRLDVPDFIMNVFNGSVAGSASYLTGSKDWTFNPVIKGINAGQAMNTLTSFKDMFTGTLSGKMQIKGNAAKKGLDSLSTQGTIGIDKGKINNIDIVNSVIDGFSGIQGLSGLITADRSAVQRNRETRFDSFNADFQMARKILEVPSLKLVNITTGKETNTIATMKGSVDLTTRNIGFTGNVAFSPDYSSRLTKRAPALNALVNDQRRMVLPIKITGTAKKPVLSLQTREINQAMANYYTKKGIEKGVEKLRERFNIPAPKDNEGSQDPLNNLLDKMIKK